MYVQYYICLPYCMPVCLSVILGQSHKRYFNHLKWLLQYMGVVLKPMQDFWYASDICRYGFVFFLQW